MYFYHNGYRDINYEVAVPQLEIKSYPTFFVNGACGDTVAAGGGLADLSGNSINGTLVGGIQYNSTFKGLQFDGSTGYIDFGNVTSLNFTSGMFSVSTWLYIPSTWTSGSQYPNLVSKGASAGWDTDGWALYAFRNYGGGNGFILGAGISNTGVINVHTAYNNHSEYLSRNYVN